MFASRTLDDCKRLQLVFVSSEGSGNQWLARLAACAAVPEAVP